MALTFHVCLVVKTGATTQYIFAHAYGEIYKSTIGLYYYTTTTTTTTTAAAAAAAAAATATASVTAFFPGQPG